VPFELDMQQLVGLALLVGGGGLFAASKGVSVLTWWRDRKVTETGDPGHNSDKLPPDGFTDHVALISASAPFAPPDVLVAYCLEGLTQAGVLLKERNRLQKLVEASDEA
jgi:hypothetical protein